MVATEPSKRRRVPVRLSEVPIELRLKAARELERSARTDKERDELRAAAWAPSETIFYVTDERLDAAA